jgi:hypothetical protein
MVRTVQHDSKVVNGKCNRYNCPQTSSFLQRVNGQYIFTKMLHQCSKFVLEKASEVIHNDLIKTPQTTTNHLWFL